MAKYFVIVAISCVLGILFVNGEFDKKAALAEFMTKAESCKAEVGATEVDLEDIMAKKPASSMPGKCLRSCIMKQFDVMDASGKFVPSVALKHAEIHSEGAADKMKMATEIIDSCAGLSVSSDHCEAAEEYGKCFKEQAIAHGLTEFDV